MIYWSDYDVYSFRPHFTTKRTKEGPVYYLNNIFVLDTEVTSVWRDDDGEFRPFNMDLAQSYYIENGEDYYLGRESKSWMYIWMMSIDGVAVYGRTIEEYDLFLSRLKERTNNAKYIIWVQNLGYEHQVLLRNLYSDMDIFARKPRKPMKITISDIYEYRDLLVYTNQSLENLGKHNKHFKKLVGDLDYNKLRFYDTELTKEEMGYCENDVLVPYEFLCNELSHYKCLYKLPMTQTGKSRKALQKTYAKDKKYNKKCRDNVPSLHCFKLLKRAFQGGYTHANALYVSDLIYNVASWDFKSSYPAVMVSEKYPYTKFMKWTAGIDKLDKNTYCWMGKVRFSNIKSKFHNNYISSYHCDRTVGSLSDNGRLEKALEIELVITDVDFDIISHAYSFDHFEEIEIWVSRKKYLDPKFVNLILDTYAAKTELKGIPEEEDLYNRQKELLNSFYGMAVTNLVSDKIDYESNDWIVTPINDYLAQKSLDEQAENPKTLTIYAQGLWITTYARRNLWLGAICKMDSDVCYCDTDSIKFIGEHDDIRLAYNNELNEKMIKACAENGIDFEKTRPMDIYGNRHELGTFDDETSKGRYKEFITLGAKRYAYRDFKGEIHITISGVNKKTGVVALKNDIRNFKEGLFFDYKTSGKMLSSYNDNQAIEMIDGHLCADRFGVTLRPTTYKLTMSANFITYVANAKMNYQISNEKEWLLND